MYIDLYGNFVVSRNLLVTSMICSLYRRCGTAKDSGRAIAVLGDCKTYRKCPSGEKAGAHTNDEKAGTSF